MNLHRGDPHSLEKLMFPIPKTANYTPTNGKAPANRVFGK